MQLPCLASERAVAEEGRRRRKTPPPLQMLFTRHHWSSGKKRHRWSFASLGLSQRAVGSRSVRWARQLKRWLQRAGEGREEREGAGEKKEE
jgi:hypothetical protein